LIVRPPAVRQGGRLGLAALGLASAFLGQALAWQPLFGEVSTAVGLSLMSAGSIIICIVFEGSKGDPSRPLASSLPLPLKRGLEVLIFLTILALAAFVRFYQLGRIPSEIWFDEASFGNTAMHQVLLPGKAPLYFGFPNNNSGLFFWILAALIHFFGFSLPVVRSISAAFGLLALIPLYFLARAWFGPRLALAAALMFACLRWGLILERAAFMAPMAMFWMLCTLAFMTKAVAWGAKRGGSLWWVLAGFCLGVSFYCYIPIRLFPVFLMVYFAISLWTGKPLASLRSLAFFFGAAALAASPLLWFALTHWSAFNGYSDRVSIFQEVKVHGLGILLKNFWRHLLMFQFAGDMNGRHNLSGRPQLDAIAGALFAPALLGCHLRFRSDPRARLLVLWFWAMLAAGFLTASNEAPQAHRSFLLLPVIPLSILLLAEKGKQFLDSTFTDHRPAAVTAACLVGLLGMSALNVQEYFGRWASDPGTWQSFSPQATAMARRLEAQPEGWSLLLSPLDRIFIYYGYEAREISLFVLQPSGRAPGSLARSNALPEVQAGLKGALCVWGDSDVQLTEAAAREFPDLKPEHPEPPFDALNSTYFALAVPRERIPVMDPNDARTRGLFLYIVKKEALSTNPGRP
jgi:4-amino-4-deoxy-L-arabinose transferase-like glycosyltransferase